MKFTTKNYPLSLSDLDERPKLEVLVLLEEQEYWRKPAPDRTQGHDVYIRKKILDSIYVYASYFEPQPKENCIKQCSYALFGWEDRELL